MDFLEGEHDLPPYRDRAAAGGASEAGGSAGPGGSLTGKIIRINGASQKVAISRLAGGGVRIEGADGIRNGETVLLLVAGDPVIELSVRWVIGDQAGAIVLGR